MALPSDLEVKKALRHPLRRQLVLILLASQPLSPTEAARLVGEPLSSVAYHMKELVRFRFLVLDSSEAVRGTEKSFYILNDGITDLRGVKELLAKRRPRTK